MGVEIERKFLVVSDEWRQGAEQVPMTQMYIVNEKDRSVRVRICPDTGEAFLTLKGAGTISRPEFEYPIPLEEARELMDTVCIGFPIDKVRHKVPAGELTWEVDVFKGLNAGLIVAEVELPSKDYPLELPAWVGAEVTSDSRYKNAELSKKPYSQWKRNASACPAPKP